MKGWVCKLQCKSPASLARERTHLDALPLRAASSLAVRRQLGDSLADQLGSVSPPC